MPDFGLSQHLAQKQIISTQMQQSLQMLQASALELQQLVQQEMAVNPVLELVQEEPSSESEDADNNDEDESSAEDLIPTEQDWTDYWSEAPAKAAREEGDEERREYTMQSITGVTSLAEFLREQITLWPGDDPELAAAVELMIGLLDERGFLSLPLHKIAEEQHLPLERLQAAQAVLMQFDPPGIGADDLRHSLMLQLERRGQHKSLAWSILDTHFDDLAAHRLPQIAKALEVDIADISRAAHVIATLNPSPGGAFAESASPYITTDVIVERDGESWKVMLTAQDVPRLRISQAYKDILAKNSAKDVREYLREKIKSGRQFINTIAQRQETIRRITEEIIKLQPEFFDKGLTHLRPMTMTPVAQALDVHETTVSRAVAGKHMQTPHGLMEMRAFFTQGVNTASGEDLSGTAVKQALENLIRAEDKRSPHSDLHLAELLAEQGILVARRTVAKYREDLGILPGNLRRTFE